MIHDPLCRRAKITEVFMEGCPECALIAKVREEMQPACVCTQRVIDELREEKK